MTSTQAVVDTTVMNSSPANCRQLRLIVKIQRKQEKRGCRFTLSVTKGWRGCKGVKKEGKLPAWGKFMTPDVYYLIFER